VLSDIYAPEPAMQAGFLDRVVPAGELRDAARATAALLAKLDMTAHAASKLRARAQTLEALAAAIAADDAEFRAR
jgi:enoyl-CoA hydratase